MSQSPIDKLLDDEIGFVTTKHDRRRPGRVEINPALHPLIRGTVSADIISDPAHPKGAIEENQVEDIRHERPEGGIEAFAALDDCGNPVRGILISIMLVIPIWSAIAGLTYWMLR